MRSILIWLADFYLWRAQRSRISHGKMLARSAHFIELADRWGKR